MRRMSLLLLILLFAGCQREAAIVPSLPTITPWPADWSTLLGQTVTLEGQACDTKYGGLLKHNDRLISVTDSVSLPSGFDPRHGQGRRVRVTGTVVRHPQRVWVRKPDEPVPAGPFILVDSDEEAKKIPLSWTYSLTGTKWVVLE